MNPIETVRVELETDPLQRGYAAMDDQQVADSLYEINRPAPHHSISSGDLLGWSASGASTGGLPSGKARNHRIANAATQTGAYTNVSDAVAGVAGAAQILLNRESSTLDIDEYSTLIDTLVDALVLASTERDELIAMASSPDISRAGELGIGEVGIGWVINARRNI